MCWTHTDYLKTYNSFREAHDIEGESKGTRRLSHLSKVTWSTRDAAKMGIQASKSSLALAPRTWGRY